MKRPTILKGLLLAATSVYNISPRTPHDTADDNERDLHAGLFSPLSTSQMCPGSLLNSIIYYKPGQKTWQTMR